MAEVFRGIDGKFFFAGNRQAKTSNWTVEASVNLLDKTELGDHAVGNLADLKSYTGTATIIYYKEDTSISNLLGRVFKTGAVEPAEAEFRWGDGDTLRLIKFSAIITSASIAVAPGEVARAEVSFTADGDLTSVTV